MKILPGLSRMPEEENQEGLNQELPPKPREPDVSECCQRNCVNCVFVYYENALIKWKKKVEEIRAANN